MGKIVITVGREYGSGGRFVAKLVADKLGIKFYDKELIALSAQESNMSEKVIEDLDEKAAERFFYALPATGYIPSSSSDFNLTMNDKLFLLQSNVIRNVANKESAVIVGRAADYVLRNNAGVLNVFIHAPLETRVQNAVKNYGLNPVTAEKVVKKTDETRKKYYNYYTGKKWGDINNYHIAVDSSLGADATVDVIVAAAKSLITK